jgi:hypothetical protein
VGGDVERRSGDDPLVRKDVDNDLAETDGVADDQEAL